MNTRQKFERQLEACDLKRRQITAQLSQLGYVWHGTLLRRRLTCGKPGCSCRRDPACRHGPYAYWTTKVAGKTVTRLLSPIEASIYDEWIANRRILERAFADLKAVSQKAASILLKLKSTDQD